MSFLASVNFDYLYLGPHATSNKVSMVHPYKLYRSIINYNNQNLPDRTSSDNGVNLRSSSESTSEGGVLVTSISSTSDVFLYFCNNLINTTYQLRFDFKNKYLATKQHII